MYKIIVTYSALMRYGFWKQNVLITF